MLPLSKHLAGLSKPFRTRLYPHAPMECEGDAVGLFQITLSCVGPELRKRFGSMQLWNFPATPLLQRQKADGLLSAYGALAATLHSTAPARPLLRQLETFFKSFRIKWKEKRLKAILLHVGGNNHQLSPDVTDKTIKNSCQVNTHKASKRAQSQPAEAPRSVSTLAELHKHNA